MNLEGTPRVLTDLSNYVDQIGKIGMLTTLNWNLVLPGDGYSTTIAGRLQFSPLRRYLVKDAKVDIVTFYTPMRFIYSNWTDFIEDGIDESISLTPKYGTSSLQNRLLARWLGLNYNGVNRAGGWPKWACHDVVGIWGHYFRPPTTIDFPTSFSDLLNKAGGVASGSAAGWGLAVPMLKTVWNTYVKDSITASDTDVSVSSGTWSLYDLEKQMAHLRTEQEREFFMKRYRDIIKNMGGYAPIDADERPELIGRSTFWTSGYDVDGTDQTTLGQYTGRMTNAFIHQIPRKFIPEHGIVRTMIVVRYPPIGFDEMDYVCRIGEPTYQDVSGDPKVLRNQPPADYKPNDWFVSGSTTADGKIPFGQHLRHKANFVNAVFKELKGYPFFKDAPGQPASHVGKILHRPSGYDDMFQTNQLGHWQISAKCTTPVVRRIPTARESLLVGE